MPIIRRSDYVPLRTVVCPLVAVVMLESRVVRCVHCVENVACLRQATFSTHCTHLATGRLHSPHNATHLTTRVSSIKTATTGQTTIGSGTQLDLLTMGVKMPETWSDTIHYHKSLFVVSSWSLLYLHVVVFG